MMVLAVGDDSKDCVMVFCCECGMVMASAAEVMVWWCDGPKLFHNLSIMFSAFQLPRGVGSKATTWCLLSRRQVGTNLSRRGCALWPGLPSFVSSWCYQPVVWPGIWGQPRRPIPCSEVVVTGLGRLYLIGIYRHTGIIRQGVFSVIGDLLGDFFI